MRSLRRFYQDKFRDEIRESLNQEACAFSRNLKSFSELLQKNALLSDIPIPKLMIYLGSIMFPKSLLKMICNYKPISQNCDINLWKAELNVIQDFTNNSLFISKIENKDAIDFSKMNINIKNILSFHDCLYKFSMKKVLNLVLDPIISKLLMIYYESINPNSSEVSSVMSKNMDAYTKAFNTLTNSINLFKPKSVLFFE